MKKNRVPYGEGLVYVRRWIEKHEARAFTVPYATISEEISKGEAHPISMNSVVKLFPRAAAEHFKVLPSEIQKRRRLAGLQRVPRARQIDQTEKDVMLDYARRGYPLIDIAFLTDRSESAVRKILEEVGFERDPATQQ